VQSVSRDNRRRGPTRTGDNHREASRERHPVMRDKAHDEGEGRWPGDGPGVLVVSDSDVLRDLLAVILKQQGFRVMPAADRASAQAALVARQVSSVVADVRPIAAEGRGFAAWLRSCGMKAKTVLVVEQGDGGDLARDLGAEVLTARELERGAAADWIGWLRPDGGAEERA